MRMNTISDSDTSCIMLQTEVSAVDLDNPAVNRVDNVSDASIIRICFRDATSYGELYSTIAKCVKNALFHFKKSVTCTEDALNYTIIFNETFPDDDDLFIVDSAPCETPEITNVIPEYSCSEILIADENAEPTKDESITTTKPATNTCFNCEGDHSIRDCTKPKDIVKIRQNRAKFSNSKVTYERYHVDAEQRFGHLVAGELSKDLRDALGLRSKDLPMHIYRMRLLGYPPGWLEHAKVSGSGLSLFDSEGKQTDVMEKDEEDKFDLKKIISFPGFNVDPPHGTRDEGRASRAPPMQPQHSKARMIEYFKDKSVKAYKRKYAQTVEVLEPTDMDIDDESDDDGMIAESPNKRVDQSMDLNTSIYTAVALPNQSPLSDGEITDDEPTQASSPSLDDLNERKKRLLVALDDSTVSVTALINKPSDDDSLIDDIMAMAEDSILDSSLNNEENGDISKADTSSTSSDLRIDSMLSTKSLLHTSKETVSGTPVIKSFSPFINLPNSQNWRQGVTDVLDFENLPESIGKYEKMRTLLGKVREKVKKIQYEDEIEDR
ncbi:Zinc finger CCHC domain-containing protein 8 like [Pseudolycoriella hygida]|uniref:Zinc finger CCHC domain-containing protein 8 like n=1 Tax=Pseudolycoriella hygida TaxID=35572 RepID=A0A9Q0S2P1_9DIPT|nr:Zinc finger CCHC domain-containing protein 8 like [Pseudolycoriella hygida]